MFAWDQEKALRNFTKHGVNFAEAATVFTDPLAVCFTDPAHSLDEERQILVGYSQQQRLLFVSYRESEGEVRLISSRLATAHERKRHEQRN